MNQEWTKKKLNFLTKKYSTESREYLKKHLSRSWEAIRKKAQRIGLTRNLPATRRPSQRMQEFYDQSKKYITLYKHGKSVQEVAKIAYVSASSVKKILQDNNIKIRNLDCSSGYRKYSLNECFFNNIDTEAKAYFFGFIYADGFVSKKSNNFLLGIEIHEKDIQILKSFKKELQSTSPLSFNHSRNSVRLRVYSKNLVHQLINKGCVENKSLILQFPSDVTIPTNLLHHFMRGYFDGDGSIRTWQDKNRPNIRSITTVSIYSTIDFCKEYQNNLCLLAKLNKTKLYKRENIAEMAYAGRHNIEKIYNFLYQDSTIYLKRKKDRFDNYLFAIFK